MPRISQLTTEAPASTSDLVLNVGSTTRRANVQQILSVPVTAQGDMLFGDSSADTTRLAPPTSGAILAYSSASSTPSWSIPTSGAVLVASSVGLPTWRAIGTSGQILESTGGTPTWVTAVDPSTGHITTAGTSGQVLQTSAGAAAWVNQSDLTGTPDPSTGHITTAGTSGQVLQTTAGTAAWVNSTTIPGAIGSSAGSSGTVLITSSGGAAIWSTEIFVNTSQHVGIGTATPGLKLTVDAGAGSGAPANSGTTPVGYTRIFADADIAMDIGAINGVPFPAWIQVHDASNQAINYPLSLNPNGGNVGIGTTGPGALLHVASSAIIVGTAGTPTSAAAGVTGQIQWDASFIYVCTSTGPSVWKRAALSTF